MTNDVLAEKLEAYEQRQSSVEARQRNVEEKIDRLLLWLVATLGATVTGLVMQLIKR